MVWAAALRASPNAISAAAAARQPIEEAGFMSVPPGRASRPRLPVLFAPAYHALARREGRRGRPPPRPSCAKLRCSPIGTLAGAAIAAMRIKPARAEAGPVPMIAALAQAVAARALDRIDGVDDSSPPLPEAFGLRRHQRRGECNPEYDRSGNSDVPHDFLPSLLQQQSNDIPDGCRGKYRERVTSMAGMP